MDWQAILTALVLIGATGLLAWGRHAAEYVLFAALCVLILSGVLTVEQAFSGLANEGVATVAVLFVVANGLSQSGALAHVAHYLLGRAKSTAFSQFRLMLPVALFSSVLNNTPVVAMAIPIVSDWCRRYKLPVSKYMIPLSYAAIIGGVCTIIGTSTNLVLNSMLHKQTGTSLGLFDLAAVGVPCLIATLLFVIGFSRWLLPSKQGRASGFDDVRQYTVEMRVDPKGPLVGKTVEEAELRELPGLYLVEIVRNTEVIPIIGPRRVLLADDRLVFAGNVDSVVDLKSVDGLTAADDQLFKLTGSGSRTLVEVVISNDYPLLNKSVKDSKFRLYYGAVIIAISRAGQQLKQRIGDVVLKPGDTLLLEANSQFVSKQRYSKDFLVVSPVSEYQPKTSRAKWWSVTALFAMIALVATGICSMFEAAIVACGLLIITRSTNLRQARKSVDTSVLLVIAASMGLGEAMQNSGLANVVSQGVMAAFSGSAMLSLIAIFVLTSLFSSVISNVAAAVLLFPVAAAVADSLGVSLTPFIVAIMVAASASFATPIGYQTNLMVYGPGGYKFVDFVRIGVPLTIVVAVVSLSLIPFIWPFV